MFYCGIKMKDVSVDIHSGECQDPQIADCKLCSRRKRDEAIKHHRMPDGELVEVP